MTDNDSKSVLILAAAVLGVVVLRYVTLRYVTLCCATLTFHSNIRTKQLSVSPWI